MFALHGAIATTTTTTRIHPYICVHTRSLSHVLPLSLTFSLSLCDDDTNTHDEVTAATALYENTVGRDGYARAAAAMCLSLVSCSLVDTLCENKNANAQTEPTDRRL